MPTLTGGAIPVVSNGRTILELNPNGNAQTIKIATEAAMTLFQNLTWRGDDINENKLGLFSKLVIGSDLKARFMRFKSEGYNIRSRKNGCNWNPTPGVRASKNEILTHAKQIQHEICADAFWDSCWERLMGVGVDVHSLVATPEGRAIFDQLVKIAYEMSAESLKMYLWYAGHPTIEDVNTAGTSPKPLIWDQFYEMAMDTENVAGFITLLDHFRAEGLKGHDKDLISAADDVTADYQYKGDIVALLEGLRNNGGSTDLGKMMKYGMFNGPRPIIKLSAPLWVAYQEWLSTSTPYTNFGYLLQTRGDDGIGGNSLDMGLYKNMPVVPWYEVDEFDSIAGTKSFRAAIFYPGSLGVAADVDALPSTNQRSAGQWGLTMTRWDIQPYKGKTMLDGYFRVGTAIQDAGLCVSTKLIL